MRIQRLISTALGATALLSGFASAQTAEPSLDALLKTSSSEELATAFKSICLDHAGDWLAQSAAGQSAPWNMKASGAITRDRAVYVAWPLQLGLNNKSSLKSCAITSSVDEGADLAAFVAKASTVLGLGQAELSSDKAGWVTGTPSGPGAVVFQIAPMQGNKVATFLLVTKKAE